MADQRQDRLSATFSPVSSTGVVLWLQPHQLTIIGVIVVWFLLNVMVGHSPFTPLNGILLVVALVAAVSVHGRSLIQIVMIHLGFGLRSATGQTQWTLNPLTKHTTVGYIDLPGAAGKRIKPLEVMNTEFAGACILFDREHGDATAILRCMGQPFVFAKTQTQDDRARAFGSLLAQLSEFEDVVRLTIQTRSLMSPFHMPHTTDSSAVSFAQQEAFDMVAENMRTIMNHDIIISLTLNPDKARDIVRSYGGGVQGISGLFKDRLTPLVSMLAAAGVETDQTSQVYWENLAQLRAMMKLMSDSHTITVINEKLELDDDIPVATNYREYTDYIHVGDTYARTLWIDKWPSDPASVGFLSQLTSSKDAQIIFTQAFKPTPENKARKMLNERKNELERTQRMNRNLGRNDDARLTLESNEVDKRLTELAINKAEVSFQGFVTIIATTKEELDTVTRNLVTSMSYLHFDRMHGQQYVGWMNALPLGQAGRA
ncbi:SCO6880 family protein [Alloscardovia criceti]|uniref:SCO6880 family protein n=1 Tax=Alloscardovia criceti TaxID=356828 RepID=UPI00037BE3C5|nr:SCO6880 family protein [Alloscardovia criceti]